MRGWCCWFVALFGAGCSAGPPGPLLLLVSIDTLRADALSSYGNRRPTSPHLDALARDGWRFAHAVSPAPWTGPAHASMLTGLDADALGVTPERPLPGTVLTLAERLAAHGFVSAGIVGHALVGKKLGFAQGFTEFDELDGVKVGEEAARRALSFIERHPRQPKLVFLHLFDVHGPYRQPPPFGERFAEPRPPPDEVMPFLRHVHLVDYLGLEDVASVAEARARYDDGVARVDAILGALLDELRRRGWYDDAAIVVTADHGEAFFEQQVFIGHGLFLEDAVLRVPLIVKPPRRLGAAPRVVTAPVGLVDVTPTLLGLAQVPATELDGRDLLVARAGAAEYVGVSSNLGDTRSLRTERWHYVEPMAVEHDYVFRRHLITDPEVEPVLRARIPLGAQLFDWTADANRDVAAAHPDIVRQLAERLAAHTRRNRTRRQALGVAGPVEFSDAERERLRALGYVH